jgi:hypothetical protein
MPVFSFLLALGFKQAEQNLLAAAFIDLKRC